MSNIQECTCNFCGSAVRFVASRAGELVNCENCGMETVICSPGAVHPYPTEEFALKAINVRWSKDPLAVRNIVGDVVNTTNRDLDWIRVEFTLVDRQAVPVGIASDCQIGFQANGVWRFCAPVFQGEAQGVSAPLISCEFGRLCATGHVNFASRLGQPMAGPSGAGPVKLALVNPDPVNSRSEWSGLRITGGLAGTAHRESAGCLSE